jgi:hypothetical protein
MTSEHDIINTLITQGTTALDYIKSGITYIQEEKKRLKEGARLYDVLHSEGKKKMTLRSILSYSSLKVKIIFPSGEEEIKSFQEFREHLLSIKDTSVCADLIKYGEITKGSLRYSLINA